MRRGVETPGNKPESLCACVRVIFEKNSKYLESQVRYKRSYT